MLKRFLNHPIIRLLRLDKPIGILLLFFPCAFSVALMAQSTSELLEYIVFFFLGSIIMRSSGCIINDIFDRNFDILVERTKTRPIATGQISILQALSILFVLLLCGLYLLLQLPILAIKIGVISLATIIIYPLIKRVSYFPQVVLGLSFNIGALIAAASIEHSLSSVSILVYLGCVFWTIGYDTVYGFMDIVDDKKIGIKSLAIKLEHKNFKLLLSIFYLIFISCIHLAATLMHANYLSLLLYAIWLWLVAKVIVLDITSISSCKEHFSNISFMCGILIFSILLILYFYKINH